MWDKTMEVRLCAERLGLRIDMSDFDGRLELQKKIYLMQLFGADLGYRFGWHLRGPYCSTLTDTGFEIAAHRNERVRGNVDFHLHRGIMERIDACRNWLEQSKPAHIQEVDWIELLASLHYLKHIAFIHGGKDKDAILSELSSRKDWIERAHSEEAWEALRRIGLIDNIKLA